MQNAPDVDVIVALNVEHEDGYRAIALKRRSGMSNSWAYRSEPMRGFALIRVKAFSSSSMKPSATFSEASPR